jgi:AcrR family transcriptional regulator
MTMRSPSPRKEELLELAYRYALEHGLGDLSLRPLAAAIGSSPRVLLFLFGSKDGLVSELLARARTDELAFLAEATAGQPADLADAVAATWRWLAADEVRPLLTLWTDAYARSLAEPEGPWSGFASRSVADWLDVLRSADQRRNARSGSESDQAAEAGRTLALAVLRGCLLDLLATGDAERVGRAVASYAGLISGGYRGSSVEPDE